MTSSDDFNKSWRFSIDKDFLGPSGDPYTYADNGLQEWGDELLNIPFSSNTEHFGPRCAAISHDAKYIVLSAKFDVRVYDLVNFKQIHTLQGHISEVDAMAFRPGKSSQLITAAMNSFAGTQHVGPQVIFWDLDKHRPNPLARPEGIERLARNAANEIVADMKSIDSQIPVSASDQRELAMALKEPILRLTVPKGVAKNLKLSGRIAKSFGSQVFNSSGSLMFYMPGARPRSNGDDDWELRLFSLDREEDHMVLSGHRDTITWTGFSPDESLIGTCSWDKTFRIWSAKDGSMQHVFTTENQNWAGAFSGDGKHFAGTSGSGKIHVYNLSTGDQTMVFDAGSGWCRALSWHPHKPLIAAGGQNWGKLYLIDVAQKEAIQYRELSSEAIKPPKRSRGNRIWGGFLECSRVKFVDEGRKIAFFTSGDGSAEVYDIEESCKWRFARVGTMNPPADDSEVTSRSGYDMIVREDPDNKKVILASVDADAVRLWSVPAGSL